jgi:Sec-independent protein translocase protein TatA
MSIGLTQLIILIIIGILLFGNLPKIFKDLGSGIVALKKEVSPLNQRLKESTQPNSLPQKGGEEGGGLKPSFPEVEKFENSAKPTTEGATEGRKLEKVSPPLSPQTPKSA